MTHRQPKLPLALRLTAAGCIGLWLVSVSACSLKALFCCDSPGPETVAHADGEHFHDHKDASASAKHAHDADALGSQEADGPSQDSHKHSKDGSCCSTLKAVGPAANPVVFGKLAFHPISFPGVILGARAASLAPLDKPPNRQAKYCDWVIAPEVCLGPAHCGLAPPSLA